MHIPFIHCEEVPDSHLNRPEIFLEISSGLIGRGGRVTIDIKVEYGTELRENACQA